MRTPANLNDVIKKAIQDALGVAHMEVAQLRAINAVQTAEIENLRAEISGLRGELETAKAKAPELPLPTREASNGARH